MGGLALKNTFTRRYEREEFLRLVDKLREMLKPQFGNSTTVPKWYFGKETFGDCDMLLNSAYCPVDMRAYIEDTFNPNEIVHNGDVWSFDVDECQVDLILVKDADYLSASNYFSWNDLGNLMGRLAHKLGTKYGFDGLTYVYRTEGKVLGTIQLTKNIDAICNFLRLDASRFNAGFNSLEDIFEFVAKSGFYSPFIYDLENLNRINRERNYKRKTYMTFLEWQEPLKSSGRDWFDYAFDKTVYLGYIEAHFPGFLKKYGALQKKEAERALAAEKFNGHILMEKYPQLSGPNLGGAITAFKSYLAADEEYTSVYGSNYDAYLNGKTLEELFATFEIANSSSKCLAENA